MPTREGKVRRAVEIGNLLLVEMASVVKVIPYGRVDVPRLRLCGVRSCTPAYLLLHTECTSYA